VTSLHLLVLVAVGFVVWACAAALKRAAVPTAVVLVIAGVVIGFLPFVPDVSLNPQLALEGFLPPLVFYSAYWTSPRSVLDDGLQVGLLAVGLVACTAGAVAVAAHGIGGLSWPMSFVLGTAVGPTDAVAATSIASRLGLPERLSNLLQNEAMFNDATALVLYAAAVTAATTGSFSPGGTAASIGYATVVGAAIGLAVAVIGDRLRRRIDDPPMVIVLSVLLAYGSYLPAEAAHASGVLAGVAAGLYLGWHQMTSVSAQTRLQSRGFWDTAEFLLNAALFILLGLTLHSFTASARGPAGRLALTGLGVVMAVVVTRLIWTAAMSLVSRPVRRLSGATHARREQAVLGWSGMRGALTLAAALAIPATSDHGEPLAGRDDAIYLAFAVIFATLLGQGLTLPVLARHLRSDSDTLDADRRARADVVESARRLLDETAEEGAVPAHVTDTVRRIYESRFERLRLDRSRPAADIPTLSAELALQSQVIETQRKRLAELRMLGQISPTSFRAIQHDLDLDEERLSSEAIILPDGGPNAAG
jgi:CPA1 family monovalent cation:H+ antiporter